MAIHVRAMPLRSRALIEWINENARLTRASKIVWCDGSEQERCRFKLQEKFFAGIGEALPSELEVQAARTGIEAGRQV
jgi:GTP-dependent phosphoenolpyruvate carboxykinase